MRAILYLQTRFIPDGPGLVVRNIINHLDRETFRPVVGCMYGGGSLEEWYRTRDIETVNIDMRGPLHGWADIRALRSLVRFIRQNRIDLVHTNLIRADIYGRIAARIAGVPVLSTVHNTEEHHSSPSPFMAAVRCVDRRTFRYCSRIVTVSEFVRQYLCTLYGLDTATVTAVHNGIEPPLPGPGEAPVIRRTGTGARIVVGTVARLHRQKGLFDFIRAVDHVRKKGIPVAGLIIGDGPLRHEVAGLIRELDAPVMVKGFQEDVYPWIMALDIFVLASHWEGFGLAIVEAMSVARPVVATRTGGIPEIVADGESGLLSNPGDPVCLAENILTLIRNAPLRRKMGDAGAERFRTLFTAKAMSAKYQDIYRDVLGVYAGGNR